MKLFAPLVMLVMLLVSSLAMAQEDKNIVEAKAAAERWLDLADARNYDATWDQSASTFQAAITKAAWSGAVQSVRAPLGAVKSRTLQSATYSKSLPGAPAGEYVVIQYLTQFDGDRKAVETVTPSRATDGSWKVSGYYIK
jgi:hypothetical protein